MKVVVLTTSYPRDANDVAGNFVAARGRGRAGAGRRGRGRLARRRSGTSGSPTAAGSPRTCARAPWKLALVPRVPRRVRASRRGAPRATPTSCTRTGSRRRSRRARPGKPYVLQVWGTDVELARRAPALVRPLVRGARIVIAASTLPRRRGARARRARASRSCRPASRSPSDVGEPDEPPHVLFAGRLSEEKGILEFLEATEGLPRVIVGDGPLRDRVPGGGRLRAAGASSAPYYERAAVVCVPSRREGYGMTAREAMALRAAGRRDAGRRARRPERRRDVRRAW